MNDNKHNQQEPRTPLLDSITQSGAKSRNDGFAVPEGYFADLEHNIISKLTQQQGEAVNNSWKSAFIRITGFAAGFAAMVALSIGLLNLVTEDTVNQNESDEFFATLQDDILYSMSQDDVLDVIWDEESTSGNDSEIIAEFNEYIELLTAELDYTENLNY